MPAVGRLIGPLTGITPQKTVNPDEAVALGCAANVGILDGNNHSYKVLNPMQAAILRVMADAEFDEIEKVCNSQKEFIGVGSGKITTIVCPNYY
jgi:molecular chaperone DnaK (HSP70)